MQKKPATAIYRKDYQQPSHWIKTVHLDFSLEPEHTLVHSQLQLEVNPNNPSDSLFLHGEDLQLKTIHLNGQPLDKNTYQTDDKGLTLFNLPDNCLLETWVEINPKANTELSGLYQSSGNFCTQCEAEGFRRITYFLDRPDVMTTFSVRIEADKNAYPVLLSNGNRIDAGETEGNRHWVQWQDPFLKPSYLFALVAGDLACHRGTFTTVSGREIQLEIWVEPQNINYCEHALVSLQNAMAWDEQVYGLEYDLDTYMIVAVNDFNMGAMENKGLNVFNAKYVLAQPDTATDEDYAHIEGVIGHEYFHNWTGNRVTCRDWFQLTLKEGLTVFRDQEFSGDMQSHAVKRIEEVRLLRSSQFVEDSGPMKHPIRPESYIEMNNFYTSTVYNKGAEVIRMYHTLLGADGFRKGMDLYFQRHDGQAVTCDDFRAAMADANQVNLDQFERWYTQAGTPIVNVKEDFNPESQCYTLTLTQSCPSMDNWQPMHMPVKMGLMDSTGQALPFDQVLQLTQAQQSFEFHGLQQKPTASLFRNFSAPIRLQHDRSPEQLAFIIAHDSDGFNRWDAMQTLGEQLLLDLTQAILKKQALSLNPLFSASFEKILQDDSLDGAMKDLLLTLPSETIVAQQLNPLDPEALHQAREFAIQALGEAHYDLLVDVYHQNTTDGYQATQIAMQQRALKNRCLNYISANPANLGQLAMLQFKPADNMTDKQTALQCLVNLGGEFAEQALQAFYQQWETDPLVIDKWFSVQAKATRPYALEHIIELSQHADFSLQTPNRAYALLMNLGRNNPHAFHRADGSGYQFLADKVLELDKINPQVGARVVGAFNQWRKLEPNRQALMQAQLERILASENLSKDIYEIVSKALA